MIYVTQVRISPDDAPEKGEALALKKAGLKKSQVQQIVKTKTSVDGRHQKVELVSSYRIEINENEEKVVNRAENKDVVYKPKATPYNIPKIDSHGKSRPIIVGFGPAGMLCALSLARAGLEPIIFEQGSIVDKRAEQVEKFWESGQLLSSSNVQFGEGGAGTFSDGKLTTRIGDSRCSFIIDTFVEFGAPREISYQAKPHIGTDHLRNVVKHIREEILRLGGEIHFDTEVKEIIKDHQNIQGVHTAKGVFSSEFVVLAIGHSARKMFSHLVKSDILLESKPFSVGVRIEHLQKNIDRALYGKFAGHPALPHGEYQLSNRDKNGRGVYTFCMCPGGYVVASASEEGGVVTNGMSKFARDGENANSGLVVSLFPEDLETGILEGVRFQQQLEKKAFVMGGSNYNSPAQTINSYLSSKKALQIGKVHPTYQPGVKASNLHKLFPSFVNNRLEEGLNLFDKKLKGFASSDAILTGVESRTSSPIRILRGENFQSVSVKGLYPCGEGAGYAGGIMSAAVDGLKIAEAVMQGYCKSL